MMINKTRLELSRQHRTEERRKMEFKQVEKTIRLRRLWSSQNKTQLYYYSTVGLLAMIIIIILITNFLLIQTTNAAAAAAAAEVLNNNQSENNNGGGRMEAAGAHRSEADLMRLASLATKLDHWLQCQRANLLNSALAAAAAAATDLSQNDNNNNNNNKEDKSNNKSSFNNEMKSTTTTTTTTTNDNYHDDQIKTSSTNQRGDSSSSSQKKFCQAHFDGHLCWPAAQAGEIIRLACPQVIYMPAQINQSPQASTSSDHNNVISTTTTTTSSSIQNKQTTKNVNGDQDVIELQSLLQFVTGPNKTLQTISGEFFLFHCS